MQLRKITIKEVEAIDFKNHVGFKQEFGTMNKIKGMNGEGKSSIGEMITWTLGGVDLLGSKLDPTPTDRKTDKTFTSVLLELDDKPVKFSHELINGKHGYYVNDIPKKATEYNDLIYSLTGSNSIDLFMCLFNPSYFPTMHWQDQRNMLFSFVSPPPQSEVLKKLPKLQADKLKVSFKKDNIADLEAFHKKNKTNKEKEVIAAKSRVETLEGQMNGVAVENLAELQAERETLTKELREQEIIHDDFENNRHKMLHIERNLKSQMAVIESIKVKHFAAKAWESCETCKQEISEGTKKDVLSVINDEYKLKVTQYKQDKLAYDLMEKIPKDWDLERVKVIEIRIGEIVDLIKSSEAVTVALATIEEAKEKHVEVTASLTESIFLLDAIKAFKAEEAVQQAEKVKALFSGVQIVLEDHLGKPWFSIAINGKNYVKLSLGEKARAGLELIAVLTQQSGILAPTFIDNAESVTSTFSIEHQAIAAYAVPDQKLVIENELSKNSIVVDCEVL